MAAATVARPASALRQRERERAPRLSLAKRSTTTDGGDAPAKKRKLNEPYVRDSNYVLRKHKSKQPSLLIHLHDTHFRFDGQEGSFAYDSPMRFVLEHMRQETVPHEMLEELLSNNVPFYDGCLIVEVHNHKTKDGKANGRRDPGRGADSKFSMHHYNEHITPSPLVPYPSKLRTDEQPEKSKSATAAVEQSSKGKEKEKENDGPQVFTVVLHPTALTQHHEMLILANTPASELRGKKRSGDTGTPTTAQPATPHLSVPPTPVTTTRGPLSQSQKMCLEQGDMYTFQSELLLATEPPLYLEPVKNPQEAGRVLEMLAHPLHSAKPPSPKSRKRTTAQMAADDAQAAEAERRMLIMDERIKPSARAGAGTAANENSGGAASLGFSRFKTLEMVRQKHEEQERVRKDEEARVAAEKRHHDEQNAVKQQQLLAANRQRDVLLAQQQQALNNRNLQAQRDQVRQQQMEQQRQAQMASHGHPQQTSTMQNPQQANFPQGSSMAQGSPMMNQQHTPMMNSSPMMPNGGFPMAPTSSQGGGSPPRPTSAAMPNRNVSMARQASQQHHGSQNNTPQMPQGTPSIAQVVPNRQMSQTPRMPPGSPAPGMQGTPTPASMQMQPTPQMGQPHQFTPEQMAMLRAKNQQNMAAHAGSPNVMQNMTPEQIQQIRAQQHAGRRAQALLAAQTGQGQQSNPQMAQAYRMQVAREQQLRHLQQMQQMGQAGSPNGVHLQQQQQQQQQQQAGQMNHAHPPTPHQANGQTHMQTNGNVPATQEQLQMAAAKSHQIAQQRLALQGQYAHLMQQYGGIQNIPSQVLQSLAPNLRNAFSQQHQQQARQQHALRAQQIAAAHAADQQVPAGQPNPQYMQALRTNQAMLQAQLQSHQGGGAGGTGAMGGQLGMGMAGGMGHLQPQQQQQQQQQQQGFGNQAGNELNQHFANMQNALQR